MSRGGRAAATATTIIGALLAAGAARADAPRSIAVVGSGEGACPGAKAVAAVLGQLLPRLRVQAILDGGATSSEALKIQVVDLGPRYRVEVGGAAREVLDADRFCDERARSAAVYAALIIDPPSVMGLVDGLPPPPPPPPARPPAPRSAIRAPIHLDLELTGAFLVAPRTGDGETTLVTGGGGLRLVGSWGLLGLVLGARGFAPAAMADARLLPGSAQLLRLPFELDLRLQFRRGPIEASVEAGAELAVVRLEGRGFDENTAGTRVEAGLRAQVGLRWWIGERVAPVLGIEAVWVPRTHDLVLDPRGTVASTPPVWIGVSLGVAFRVR